MAGWSWVDRSKRQLALSRELFCLARRATPYNAAGYQMPLDIKYQMPTKGSQSEKPHYASFFSLPTPVSMMARFLISLSRRADSVNGMINELPMSNIETPTTLNSLEIWYQTYME